MKKILLIIMIYLGLSTSIISQNGNPGLNASSESQGINSEALQNITGFITNEIIKDQIVGVELLIIKNGYAILHEAFGWNDKEDSTLMKVNSIFNIRSMTKTFTGAGIQILIENGKLRLDDKASEYLPGFINPKSKEITIEQLLTHRSGLPLSIMKDFSEFGSLIELANAIGEVGPEIEPNKKFSYSDSGADVLGAIIEVVTKMPLNEFLYKSILEPLKMYDTYPITKKTDLRNSRVVSSYGGTTGNWSKFWKYDEEPIYPFTLGAQSYFSTPMDYSKFLQMLSDKDNLNAQTDVLTANSIKRILKPVDEFVIPRMELKYQTGFPNHVVYHGQMSMLFINNENDSGNKPLIFGYGGSDGTFGWACPEKDLIVLYFTQSRNFGKINPFLEFEKVVYKNLIDTTWEEKAQIIPEKYQTFVGCYIADHGDFKDMEFKIVVQNNNLAIDIPGQGIFGFNDPDDDGLWPLMISNQFYVQFISNEVGKTKEMLIYQETPLIKTADDSKELVKNGKYLGSYYLAALNKNIKIIIKNNKLAIQFSENSVIELNEPEKDNRWYFKDSHNKYIYFITNETGKIESFNLVTIEELQKNE